MRMWLVDPALMCRKHLLGEHLEMHMFAGCLLRGKNISGYIRNSLVEVHSIKARHARLAEEMVKRGYQHASPLPEFKDYQAGSVDIEKSLQELRERCPDCARLMDDYSLDTPAPGPG